MHPKSRSTLGLLAAVLWTATSALAADLKVQDSDFEALHALVEANPSEFTGFSVNPEKRELIVYHAAEANKAHVERLLAKSLHKQQRPNRADDRTWSVRWQGMSHSRKDLDEAFTRVQTAESWRAFARQVLTGYEIDVERGVVAVKVTAVTPELIAATKREFGSKVELRVAPNDNVRYSRSNDSPAWYGGIPMLGLVRNAVFSNQIFPCTAGFAVTDSNGAITGLLTAGHCFSPGAAIRQADNEYVGAVLHTELTHRGLDLALVGFGESYQGAVYINELTATWVHPRAATQPNLVKALAIGDVVCWNGAMTGEKCTAKITSLDTCEYLDPYTETCKLIAVRATNGVRIGQRGDSGGPVYTRYNGYIWPRGIIIGGNDPGTVGYFHSIATALKGLGAAPNLRPSCCWRVMTL